MQNTLMPKGAEQMASGAPHLDLSRIAQDLQIRKIQVESVVQLLDEGNTIPFITRYRKERTGGLNEEVLRQIRDRVGRLRDMGERKLTILKSIEGQGKLTDELRGAVRGVLWETASVTTAKHERLAEGQGAEYKDYFQFREAARTIPPHRILAINRGEKENNLAVRLEFEAARVQRAAAERLP